MTSHSRHLRLLPRQRRRSRRGRRDRRGGAGGAVHAEEARPELSDARGRLLPARGRTVARQTSTTSCSTRSRCASSSGCSRPTSATRRRVQELRDGDAGLAAREAAVSPKVIRRGHRRRASKAPLVFTDHHESHAASAFFPSPFDEAAILTLDGVGEWSTTAIGVGTRQQDHADARAAVPALARPAVLRVHLLLRLQGEQRRVQADGPGAVRAADLPRSDHEAPHRPQGRRQLLAGHAVLQLLPGPDDDRPDVPRAVRRPAAQSRDRRSSSGTWIWRRASRRSPKRSCWRWARRPSRRPACAISCWPAASRSTAWPTAGCCARGRSTTSGFSPPRVTPAARSARRCSCGTSCSTSRASATGRDHQKGSLLGPRYTTAEICEWLDGMGVPYHRASRRARAARARRRPARRREDRRLVPGPDGVRSAGARRAQHPRRSAVAEDAGDDEPEDQVPGELPAVRADRARIGSAHAGSISSRVRRARTCCSSRRCGTSTVCPSTKRTEITMASDPGSAKSREHPPLDDSGGDARRLQRARPDGR